MGNVETKARLGEKVNAAKKKFKEESKLQSERSQLIKAQMPKMSPVILQSVAMSFETCSAFLEPSLLAAWHSNPAQCEKIVLKACKKVLNAPIAKEEWDWFNNYVLGSSVWLFRNYKNNNYMYQELMNIANAFSKNISKSMDSIYVLLQRDDEWGKLMAIKHQTIISRQDHRRVGLLQELSSVTESKGGDEDGLHSFIDGNVAVNILVASAKKIHSEFQSHMKHVLGHYGQYQSGPLKQVERCQSKTENDYFDAKWPKSAKLLDIIRCSCTFNTLGQMIDGYNGLMSNIKNNPSIVEVSRVKNGFIDKTKRGYRDIKINVLYHSQIHSGLNMICEVQLLLVNYLWEKKKIHKLYSIIRQQEFFRLVVTEEEEQKTDDSIKDKAGKSLKLETNLELKNDMKTIKFKWGTLYKCSVDPKTGLLGMEGIDKFACVNLQHRKVIFEQKIKGGLHHNHHFVTYKNQKYVTVQTEKNLICFFAVRSGTDIAASNLQIKVDPRDEILLLEFDKEQTNFVLIINRFDRSNNSSKMRLQQHSVSDISKKMLIPDGCMTAINLTEPINTNVQLRQMVLGNNARFVVIAGGDGKKYFYLIDLKEKSQTKLKSNVLWNTYAPCFIDNERVAVGDSQGTFEIWNLVQRKATKSIVAFPTENTFNLEKAKQKFNLSGTGAMGKSQSSIVGMVSSQEILCVCSDRKQVKLYDTKGFNELFSVKYELEPYSLHLTSNLQYLTIGGRHGEMCTVYNIK